MSIEGACWDESRTNIKPHHPSHVPHCFHPEPSLRLARVILSGVEHLHSQGIVHRDIKPGNVSLSENGDYDQRPGCVDISCSDCKQPVIKRYLDPRIRDFGLVAEISDLNDSMSVDTRDLASKTVGTEFYRPPLPSPQHGSQGIAQKLDVFALGTQLFELLWRMNTKTEHHRLLSNLSKRAILSENFATRIDPRGVGCCRIDRGGQDGARYLTIGECVEDCIRNMVCAPPVPTMELWLCEGKA